MASGNGVYPFCGHGSNKFQFYSKSVENFWLFFIFSPLSAEFSSLRFRQLKLSSPALTFCAAVYRKFLAFPLHAFPWAHKKNRFLRLLSHPHVFQQPQTNMQIYVVTGRVAFSLSLRTKVGAWPTLRGMHQVKVKNFSTCNA